MRLPTPSTVATCCPRAAVLGGVRKERHPRKIGSAPGCPAGAPSRACARPTAPPSPAAVHRSGEGPWECGDQSHALVAVAAVPPRNSLSAAAAGKIPRGRCGNRSRALTICASGAWRYPPTAYRQPSGPNPAHLEGRLMILALEVWFGKRIPDYSKSTM